MSIIDKHIFSDHTQTCPRLTRVDDQTLLVRAAAKINLSLAVGAERPDGYHTFESLMATVSLFDELTIRRDKPGITLACDDSYVPTDSRNLVYRAASLLAWCAKVQPDVHIEIVKRIPTEAGLGGASSDAAAALIGLNELWNLTMPLEKLHQISSVLGSDVNFFLAGPLAICRGRGEHVEPLNLNWDFRAVILQPAHRLPTGKVYRHHRVSDPSCFGLADRLAKLLPARRPGQLTGLFQNDLEPAAFRVNDSLGSLRHDLEAFAGTSVRLSGSGSAMFAIFDTWEQSVEFMLKIGQAYPELACWLVRSNPW